MKNLFDLTGKVALITGASSGLGVQMAQGLAGQGAKLAIVARRMDRLEKLAKEFEDNGTECLPVKCDITKEEEISEMVDKVISHYGQIDILVNNAGMASGTASEDMTLEEWDKIIRLNLTGSFLVSREVGKHMIARRYGKIINTCSIQGIRCTMGMPGTPYNSSKGGDIMMVRSLAAEWAQYGITVNGIGPGYFPTDIDKEYLATDYFKGQLAMHCPMGRIGRDGELNGVLIYFASDASSYTTGQIMYVDGGWTLV